MEEATLARLIIALGKRAGTTLEVGDTPISVGRLASCELPIEEPQASRNHFEVVRRNGDAWLKDLGSRNGTFLNEARVEGEAKLEEGDRIRVGATVILFEAAPPPLPSGTKLGPYEIVGTVERRKGLTVHEARHASLDRAVLVDVLAPDDPLAPSFLARARQGSAFDHPSLLAIYDAGEQDGRAYRVREVMVDARDLEARLREGRLDPELAIRVAREVALGLAHIHSKGAVHGHLTPRAILVDDRGSTPSGATRGSRRSRPRRRRRAASSRPPRATSTRSAASSSGW